jgi:hypothetical protein
MRSVKLSQVYRGVEAVHALIRGESEIEFRGECGKTMSRVRVGDTNLPVHAIQELIDAYSIESLDSQE